MALTFNLMENDIFRPMLMKVLMDGELVGERKGEAKLLTGQLQRRFGPVPDWASEKIAKAEPSSLEAWSLRIFDAQSLEDVFS